MAPVHGTSTWHQYMAPVHGTNTWHKPQSRHDRASLLSSQGIGDSTACDKRDKSQTDTWSWHGYCSPMNAKSKVLGPSDCCNRWFKVASAGPSMMVTCSTSAVCMLLVYLHQKCCKRCMVKRTQPQWTTVRFTVSTAGW